MTEYKHILMAVDFTPEAELVTNKGRNLAALFGAKTSLIHVVEFSSAMYPGESPLPEDANPSHRLMERARIDLKELAVTHGLPEAKRHVELGVAKHEIVRIAKDNDVDLIVIGSHGRHGLQLLLGSTANGVLHLAGCDVLAVRVGL